MDFKGLGTLITVLTVLFIASLIGGGSISLIYKGKLNKVRQELAYSEHIRDSLSQLLEQCQGNLNVLSKTPPDTVYREKVVYRVKKVEDKTAANKLQSELDAVKGTLDSKEKMLAEVIKANQILAEQKQTPVYIEVMPEIFHTNYKDQFVDADIILKKDSIFYFKPTLPLLFKYDLERTDRRFLFFGSKKYKLTGKSLNPYIEGNVSIDIN